MTGTSLQDILNRAYQALQRGDLAAARQSLTGQNGLALTHHAGLTLLGAVHMQQGEAEPALAAFDAAIAKAPGLPEAHANRAQALRRLGRTEEALASYDKALSLRPDDPATLCNRGNVLADLGREAEALTAYERALALRPGEPVALVNRAAALQALGRLDEALAAYDSLIAGHPNYAVAHCNRARVLQLLQRSEAALEAAETALRLQPGYPEALANRGLALRTLGRAGEALACFEAVLRQRPESHEAHCQSGLALQALGRPAEALAAFDRALALDPNELEVENHRGTLLRLIGRSDEALACYGKVLDTRPEDPVALFGRGVIRLQRGDFEAGWRDYEARWQTADFQGKTPDVEAPLWAGEPLAGKRLLVHAEQGLGDCLQFVRYLQEIPADGGQVTLLVKPRLTALLRAAFDGIEIVDSIGALTGDYDYRAPLMSLPHILGTRLETVPAAVPYLVAEPARVAAWRDRLGAEGFRVGIAWQGNPVGLVDRGRSLPLAEFAPFAAVPGVRLISLQAQHGLEQLDALPPGMAVETLGADFDAGPDAFLDSAAVMANLDLVAVSDSALAHLAGALARPTWLALKQAPDWRWMLDRTDSPWYPSLRLFRQTRDGDWSSVFAAMAEALRAKVESSTTP